MMHVTMFGKVLCWKSIIFVIVSRLTAFGRFPHPQPPLLLVMTFRALNQPWNTMFKKINMKKQRLDSIGTR